MAANCDLNCRALPAGQRRDDVVRDLHRLTGWALDSGVSLEGLEVIRPSLEDVYLSLTAASAGEAAGPP